ncbi:MAG: HAMP domain-containing sensor histidine kinase [Vicinamibacterales bacterium]
MLYEFIALYRDEIIDATCQKAARRLGQGRGTDALRNGVPVFLTQVSEALLLESQGTRASSSAIAASATSHGGELLGLGLTVSEVVHVYGDICQAITELALLHCAPVEVDEFRVLNRSLDTAIAEAVTEHVRLTTERTSRDESARLGQLAHELRTRLNTALLALSALKTGAVAVNGTTGALLSSSLTGLRALIESAMLGTQLSTGPRQLQAIDVHAFLANLAKGADVLAEHSGVTLSIEPIDPALRLLGDPQMLTSALMTLLENAFEFTPTASSVTLGARADGTQVRIEIDEACGGLPEGHALLRAFGESTDDDPGLGVSLSMARRAILAQGGKIHLRTFPNQGCTFVVELPLAVAVAVGSL